MFYIGLGIHKNYSAVAVTDGGVGLVDRHRVSHRYREELTGYFNQFPLKTQVVNGGLLWVELAIGAFAGFGIGSEIGKSIQGADNSGESN